MSPRTKALLTLAATIFFGVGPHVPELATTSGLAVPNWVKFIGALIAAAGAIVIARYPSISQLDVGNGKNSSGGQGQTLGGKPSVPPPANPYRVLGLALVWSLVVAVGAVVACGPNAQTAVNQLSPAANCLTAALLSGQIDVANPGTAALQLLSLCGPTTAASVVSFIEGLIGASDAGIGASPTYAALPAILVELKKLPPTYTDQDAKKALAAQGHGK
jgi:hypothetical protein